MTNIIESLNWRYATKAYDSSKKLTQEQINNLLEVIRLSPSSYGLQPYKVIHVKTPEIREKLKAASWGQTQITDASDLFVFAVPTNLNDKDVDDFINLVATVRGAQAEQLKGYADMIKGSINGRDDAGRVSWAAKQAYIALGLLLEAAALEKIDATPMEGFDNAQYNEILGLNEQNLTSVVVAAVGYRSETDEYINLKKVRKDIKDLVIEK